MSVIVVANPLAALTDCNRNLWLALTFLMSLCLIGAFGVVYHRMYKKDPSRFAFNSDILDTQKQTFFQRGTFELSEVENQIRILEEALTALANGAMPLEPERNLVVVPLASGFSCELFIDEAGAEEVFARTGTSIIPACSLRIRDARGQRIATHALTLIQPSLRQAATRVIAELESQKEGLEQKLNSLPTRSPQIWSLQDFVYFSTVTQTTVGYGDILPNSTVVRRVVILQIVLSYLIVVVVLNLVFSRS